MNRNNKYYRYFYTEKYLNDVVTRTLSYSTATGVDNVDYNNFKRSLKENIINIKKSTLIGEYKFMPYKELLIIKDRESFPRCISIPTIRDKVCLRALSELLKEYFKNIPAQVIPQKHVSTIQNNINNYEVFIKLDIRNFFGEINHNLLMKKIKTKIKSPIITKLILDAIENPTGGIKNEKGLPQGISISNILSHIFLSDLDEKYSNIDNIMYCRYVDDILIFCNNSNYKEVKENLIYELNNTYKLNLNKDKVDCRPISQLTRKKPLIFLGYTFFKDTKQQENQYITSIKDIAKLSIEKKIVSLLNRFKNNKSSKNKKMLLHELNRLITGSISREIDSDINKTKRFGWLFFYSQITDETILWHLDKFIDKQIDNIISKNMHLSDYISEIKSDKKSFVRTYYEIKYNFQNSNYFFCPDNYTDTSKSLFLSEILGFPDEKIRGMNSEEIDKRFRSYVYRKMKRDEMDLIKIIGISH